MLNVEQNTRTVLEHRNIFVLSFKNPNIYTIEKGRTVLQFGNPISLTRISTRDIKNRGRTSKSFLCEHFFDL